MAPQAASDSLRSPRLASNLGHPNSQQIALATEFERHQFMTEEQFDICDVEDRVIGQAARSVVHAQNLLHRAVHLFVFNRRGELWGQMRSTTKDQYPSTYTSSASGHVAAGDDYLPTAHRELHEEIGLTGELEFLAKFPAGEQFSWEHTVLYRLVTDAVPIPDPQEVARLDRFLVADWLDLLHNHPERFSPAFATLLSWYAEHC